MKNLFLVILLTVIASTALGQSSGHPLGVTPCEDTLTFGLAGLDNDSMYVVKLMPDSYHKTASLFLTRANIMKISQVWKVDSVIGHGKSFTEVQLRLQATEGTRRVRKMIFCVAGGKLRTALDIFAGETGHPDGFIDATKDSMLVYDQTLDYNIAISIGSASDGSYMASLHETRKLEAVKNTAVNSSFERTYDLTFDTEHHVFYDSLLTMKDRYTLVSSAYTTPKISIDTKIPSLKLYYPERYYFINDGWYTAYDGETTLTLRP